MWCILGPHHEEPSILEWATVSRMVSTRSENMDNKCDCWKEPYLLDVGSFAGMSTVEDIIERCVFNKDRTNYTRDWFLSWSVNERSRRELRFSWRCLLAYAYNAMNRMSATAMTIVKMVITTTPQNHSRHLTCGPEPLDLVHPHTLSGIMEAIKRLRNTIPYVSLLLRCKTDCNYRWWCCINSLLDIAPFIFTINDARILPSKVTYWIEWCTSHPDTSHGISCHSYRWCTATDLTPRCEPTHFPPFLCTRMYHFLSLHKREEYYKSYHYLNHTDTERCMSSSYSYYQYRKCC